MNKDKISRTLFADGKLITGVSMLACLGVVAVLSFLVRFYAGNVPNTILGVAFLYLILIYAKGSGFRKLIKNKNLKINSLLCCFPITQSIAIFQICKILKVPKEQEDESTLTYRRRSMHYNLKKFNWLTLFSVLFYISVLLLIVPNVPLQVILTYEIIVVAILYMLTETWYTNIIFRAVFNSEIINWTNYFYPLHLIYCFYFGLQVEKH